MTALTSPRSREEHLACRVNDSRFNCQPQHFLAQFKNNLSSLCKISECFLFHMHASLIKGAFGCTLGFGTASQVCLN